MAQQTSGSKSRFILVNKYGFYFLIFSLYMFEQSVYGTLVDHETGNSDTSGNITYFLIQVTLSLGFLFFAVSRRILKTIPARRKVFYAGTYFSSYPRLFMIIGYLVIGLAYDFFGKRFIHIFGLCSMAVCFVST